MLLDDVKALPWYRGQASEETETKGAGAVLGRPDDGALPGLGAITKDIADGLGGSPPGTYLHQSEALSHLFGGKDCLLCAPAGSGRRTAIAMAACAAQALLGRSSLVLVPRERMIEDMAERIEKVFEAAVVSTVTSFMAVRTRDEFDTALAKGVGTIITTPTFLLRDLTRKSGDSATECWLDDVNVVGVAGLSMYRPGAAAHLSALCRMLRARCTGCLFLLTSLPLRSPERTASELLGRDAFVVSEDTSPKNGHVYARWFPALEANPDREEGSYLIRRAKASEETVEVASDVVRTLGVRRLLIWHGLGPFPEDRRRTIRGRLAEKLQASGEEETEGLDVFVVEDPDEVPARMFRSFDLVLCMGDPGRSGTHRGQLANLVREGGLVLEIVPEDPDTFLLLQKPQVSEHLPAAPELVVPLTRQVDTDYLRLLLGLSVARSVRDAGIRSITRGDPDVIGPFLEDGLLRRLDEDTLLVTRAPEKHDDASTWERLAEEVITLSTDEGEPRSIDTYRIPFTVQDGGVCYLEGRAFHPRLAEKRLDHVSSGHPMLTIPDLELSFSPEADLSPALRIPFRGLQRAVRITSGSLTVTERGTHHIGDLSDDTSVRSVTLVEPVEWAPRGVPAIMVESEHPLDTAILLDKYLTKEIMHPEEALTVFPDADGSVVIAALHPTFRPLLEDLWNRLPDFLGAFYVYGFEVLKACPCINGCPRCIAPIMRRYRGKSDKAGLFNELGALLGREDTATEWEYKTRGLQAAEVQGRYIRERDLIVPVYRDRFDLTIGSVAPLSAAEDLGDAAGIYVNSPETGEPFIRILAPQPQAKVIQVIAHELAHNWQYDPTGPNIHPSVMGDSIPYGGKMILEGFAQWASFKVCDHRALYDQASSIRLWVDDEYGDGFDFLNWLEMEVAGFSGVIGLVTTGSVTTPDGTVKNIGELLAEWYGVLGRQQPRG